MNIIVSKEVAILLAVVSDLTAHTEEIYTRLEEQHVEISELKNLLFEATARAPVSVPVSGLGLSS